jgi:hypothetical protein
VYHLKNLPNVTVVKEAKCGHENTENKLFLYAVSDQVKVAQPLNQEIAKLFGAGGRDVDKKFENFLELLRISLDNDLESFLEDQEIDSLPENEEEWNVPAPEIPKTPEIVQEELVEPVFPTQQIPRRQYEDDGALHCWPPRSSVSGIKSSNSEQRPQEKALETWPLPEAPPSIKNQLITEKTNHLHKNKAPAESSNVSNEDQTMPASGTGFKQDDSTGNIIAAHPQNRTGTQAQHKQQPPLAPDENVKSSTPNTERDSKRVDTTEPVTGTSEEPKQSSQMLALNLHDTTAYFSNVYSPDMQVTIQDLEFENLPTEDVSLPESFAINENPNKEDIGRWGEMFVYEYLKKQFHNPPDNSTSIEIKWMNEQANSTSPYDIVVREIANGIERTVTYVEVKSTSGNDKEHFEISAPELRFALKQREKLHLYRIFNAGNCNAVIRILRVKNLAAHLEKKTVKIFMIF